MDKLKLALAHADECPVCQGIVEDIGPLHGPPRPPHPSVTRWSMSPAEWAGQE
jgi:hypothetical protein